MSEPEFSIGEVEEMVSGTSEGPWRWRQDYEMPDGDKHWELSNAESDKEGKTIDASLILLLDKPEWLHRDPTTFPNWKLIAAAPSLARQLVRVMKERDAYRNNVQATLSVIRSWEPNLSTDIAPHDAAMLMGHRFDKKLNSLRDRMIEVVEHKRDEWNMASHNTSDGWERREIRGKQDAANEIITALKAVGQKEEGKDG